MGSIKELVLNRLITAYYLPLIEHRILITTYQPPLTMNRFFKSFQYAWQGLKLAMAEQRNLRFHSVIALLVVVLSFVLQISFIEWGIIIVCIGMVISAELFNSAIEKWVDVVSPERNKKAGDIKDISAAAVLILAIMAVIIGCIIFGKQLLLP